MSGLRRFESLARKVRRRQWLIVGVLALPWVATAPAMAWRLGNARLAWVAAFSILAITFVLAYARSRRFDSSWLTRALDSAVPEFEDSSALLLRSDQSLSDLQALQHQRVNARAMHVALPDLRPPFPRPALALSWAAASVLLVFAVTDRRPGPDIVPAAPVDPSTVRGPSAVVARILQTRITIQPPAYTGLASRTIDGLSARAPAGSMLQWALQVAPVPRELRLATRDEKNLPLRFANGVWRIQAPLIGSMLYRVMAADLPTLDSRLHRIDAIADSPPRVRVLSPFRTLNIASPNQRVLELTFEAVDDYGIASASLLVTFAQGSGENIGVRTQTLSIVGSGSPGRRKFFRSLDLSALGMQPGDDLIAQLHVVDNRRPQPQSARSASVILRWPPPASSQSSGMEGLVQAVLPAYFRSQRQIIIDSEALLKARDALTADSFVQRSDAIGVDQRLLRLRYGQFLGEEAESGSRSPLQPREADASAEAKASSTTSALFADAHVHASPAEATVDKTEPGPATVSDRDHAKPAVEDSAVFGDAVAVTDEFGHSHDIAEAATLLDPATQKLLRAALGEMWQAELHLRQGFPKRALPFENRALDLIKQVQQADRIYLAKVGLEIPAIDEARRLTGKRDGVRDRIDSLEAAPTQREALLALWMELGRELGTTGTASRMSRLANAEGWLAQEPQTEATLDVLAAIDALRLAAGCSPCAERLRASLWPLLPRPVAGVRRRSSGPAAERAYLDALARAQRP